MGLDISECNSTNLLSSQGDLRLFQSCGCSKTALLRFSEDLAWELERARYNIQVFYMNPGFVQTEMIRRLITDLELLKWQPHVGRFVGSHYKLEPESFAKAKMKLLKIAGPALSGRFSVQIPILIPPESSTMRYANWISKPCTLHYNTVVVEPLPYI